MVSRRPSHSSKLDRMRTRAVARREVRSNGVFVYGVKTTGIYCRPVCPARPHPKNLVFFDHAQSAESAGYRACKRCRPEVALGLAASQGTRAVLGRALRRMKSGEYHQEGETLFAEKLGIGGRHLRRIFKAEFGISPKRYADEVRLQAVLQFVLHSARPFAEISETGGFGSIRRFNSAFKNRFQLSPTDARSRSVSSRKVSR